MMEKKKIHLGAYCLARKDNGLLVIRKSRGPYKGKYDLPGGRIEFGEKIADCLRRELDEETGLSISDPLFLGVKESIFDYIDDNGIGKSFHHIGIYHHANIIGGTLKIYPDEYDSNGALFLDMENIRADDFSPIAYDAITHFASLLQFGKNGGSETAPASSGNG